MAKRKSTGPAVTIVKLVISAEVVSSTVALAEKFCPAAGMADNRSKTKRLLLLSPSIETCAYTSQREHTDADVNQGIRI